jgi:thiol-disulfide isomerase/thioredoxin
MNYKSILKEVIIALLLLFVISNIISYIRQPELGTTQLPKIEAALIDGSIYKVQKGKPVILHFWATSCPACKLEASNIEAVSKKYEVLSIAVNSGNDEHIKVYMQEYGLGFNVLNDKEGRWAEQFNIEAYPTTFIYDAKGKLRFIEVGYTTTAGLLARMEWINR